MNSKTKKDQPLDSVTVILISVDSKYFRDHAVVWAWSVFINSMRGHIHIINPSAKDVFNAKAIYQNTDKRISFSTEYINLKKSDKITFLTCSRFFFVEELFDTYERFLITDADSIFLKKFKFPKEDVGLFLRDPITTEGNWTEQGTKVASGIISLSGEKGRFFIKQLVKKIKEKSKESGWKFFLDQLSIWLVYSDLKEKNSELSFHIFKKEFLDWEFNDSSIMWTGKGERKYSNKKYLKKKDQVESDYLTYCKIKHKRYFLYDFQKLFSKILTFLFIFKRI